MLAGAGHPSAMMASTELGVYVKWALLLQVIVRFVRACTRPVCLGSGIALLRTPGFPRPDAPSQEQLEHVQAERLAVLQRCLKLQADNQLLRQTLQEENPTKYAHLAPPNAQPSQAISVQAGSARRLASAPAISAQPEESSLSAGNSSLAAASTAAGDSGTSSLEPDVLNTPNLQLLASFLKDENDKPKCGSASGAEARAASNVMSTRRRSNSVGSDASGPLDLPPLVADGSAEDASRAAKLPRRSHSGRSLSAFNSLAAASARKAARCETGP